MKTKIFKHLSLSFILLGFCGMLFCSDAFADHLEGKSGLYCKFTKDKKMETNFKTAFDDENLTLQPGDDITFHISLENEYSGTATWYMTNEVINSFEQGQGAHTGGEEGGTTGGVYEYVLTYVKPDGSSVVLYDSKVLGGTGLSEELQSRLGGLREATDELKDYFYLDDLTSGQKAGITLNIALDGETQGNAYQDTLADLQMNFAVELPTTPTPTPTVTPTPSGSGSSTNRSSTSSTSVVKTGDETNLRGYFIAAAVAGGVLLVLGILSVRYRRKMKEDDK